jgi:type I restriction-modification system DNA methylase subunit
MELFAAAGIDLPTTGAPSHRERAPLGILRVPLLNYKVVQRARERVAFAPSEEETRLAVEYARKINNQKFLAQKETAVRPIFIRDILEGVLGYRTADPEREYSLAYERPIRRGFVDIALGRFDDGDGPNQIIAPFEMKGPEFTDLDRVMPGRGISPVQQAWNYAIDAPGSRWVLVSNCVKIRLYAFGRGRDAYEVFDLSKLNQPEEHARLWLLLSAERLIGGETERLLKESDSAAKDITNVLYSDYKGLRDRLLQFLMDSADGPKLKLQQAIEAAQKTLDRVLFVAFCQRRDLLPENILERTVKAFNEWDPKPIWVNFRGMFRKVDKGDFDRRIPAYNGGLFAPDPVVDSLIIPDPLATDIAKLGDWDYRSEVPVTVLGHIFEQSITDIERLRAEARGEAAPDEKQGKKKKEGVVYTPDMVTRFLVEQTIGRTLAERRAALTAAHDMTTEEGERGFWRGFLDVLRGLTVLDPACGSGAFLVAAFDELARHYRDATTRLEELGETIDFDAMDEIVTRNLHGVDLNAESAEITRLALWLKTARRERRLKNLEATIKAGNSLIADKNYTERPFDWRKAFPEVMKAGGFDIVIGNPPYVRMEHLKAQKPYLEEHYVVADDRTDLYAYFFEKGVRLLKDGGRLGYISSSTFFRTGSGEKLRVFLRDGAAIETVVDFGDLQLFEGVTTYPAILTLRKGAADGTELAFLNVKDEVPEDLSQLFETDARPMFRARLTKKTWRFETEELARLRDKIVTGRKTLGEVYGAPLYGIKTGFNDAFIIDRATRDRLVKDDPKSTELLKPFLRGENIKRWRVESDDLFLINTPKGKVDIEAYPALKKHLLPFRKELEKRATKQEWWELQQAQLAYQQKFQGGKIVYPDMTDSTKFSIDTFDNFVDCTVFFITTSEKNLTSMLNSKAANFFWKGLTPEVRGGFIRFKAQYVEQLPIPDLAPEARSRLAALGEACTTAARTRWTIISAIRRRILDLAPPERRELTGRLEDWHELDFAGFLAEVRKAFRADIPLKKRGEWEEMLAEERAKVEALTGDIERAEREIDALV